MLPSDERLTVWALECAPVSGWGGVEGLLIKGLQKHWRGHSLDECTTLAEERAEYVLEVARNKAATARSAGTHFPYAVDEREPYIRRTEEPKVHELERLRAMNPYRFEEVCSQVVSAIGSTCQVTQKSNDGGVDFFCTDLRIVPSGAPFPSHCALVIIGQAKRYGAETLVTLNELRQFVGAAMRFISSLREAKSIPGYGPVLLAFWSTGEFHSSALNYARDIGVWTVAGESFVKLTESFGVDCS